MALDPKEKERLAQLGCDRRLAEAVDNLDLIAAEFTRIAGDENSAEEAVMQAASNYRAAVQRRNIAYDKSLGIPDDQAGKPAATITHTIDEEALKEQVGVLVAAYLDGVKVAEAVAKQPAETKAGTGGEAAPPKSTEAPKTGDGANGSGKGGAAAK